MMRAWHLIPEKQMAIGAAAKCGSTSLRKVIQGSEELGCSIDQERVPETAIPKGYTRIGIVRHPVARYYSLWNNVQERPRSRQNYYAQFEGKDPEEMLDGILRVGLDHDVHTQPQYLIGLEKATALVRLENLGAWWEKVMGTEFPHRNASKGLAMYNSQDSLSKRVLGVYPTDYTFWEEADAGS